MFAFWPHSARGQELEPRQFDIQFAVGRNMPSGMVGLQIGWRPVRRVSVVFGSGVQVAGIATSLSARWHFSQSDAGLFLQGGVEAKSAMEVHTKPPSAGEVLAGAAIDVYTGTGSGPYVEQVEYAYDAAWLLPGA